MASHLFFLLSGEFRQSNPRQNHSFIFSNNFLLIRVMWDQVSFTLWMRWQSIMLSYILLCKTSTLSMSKYQYCSNIFSTIDIQINVFCFFLLYLRPYQITTPKMLKTLFTSHIFMRILAKG